MTSSSSLEKHEAALYNKGKSRSHFDNPLNNSSAAASEGREAAAAGKYASVQKNGMRSAGKEASFHQQRGGSRSRIESRRKYEQQTPQRPLSRLEAAKSETDIFNMEKEKHVQHSNSDWMLLVDKHQEPIYDAVRPPSSTSRPSLRKPNEHYYSSTPDVMEDTSNTKASSKMSITIKMTPKSSNLQMNLNDLNRIKKQPPPPPKQTEDIWTSSLASTATSGFIGQFKKTKDFGDFQILSNSPEKPKVPPKPLRRPPAKMVDV